MTIYFPQGSQKTNAIMVSAPVHLGKFIYHIRNCKLGIMNVIKALDIYMPWCSFMKIHNKSVVRLRMRDKMGFRD